MKTHPSNDWTRPCRIAGIALASAALASCGVISRHSHRNDPICPAGTDFAFSLSRPAGQRSGPPPPICLEKAGEGAPATIPRVARAQTAFTAANVPDVFVGLAISGGGSRAANFGLAVMEQLHAIGLLQQVSAISTTSGGGLPGALYAVREGNLNWQEARELMRTDFLGRWITSNLLPHHLLSTTFTHEDRSDLMTEVFEETLFGKARYQDLGEFRPGTHPMWIANATDIGLGQRFPFSEASFRNIGSRLDTYPIAQAVTASAAFPGAFNTVTLRQYLPRIPRPGGGWREPVVSYKHLIDGGPADNLGVEALLGLASSHAELKGTIGKELGLESAPCLIAIVDAYPRDVENRLMREPDPRRWYDHLIDLNFLDAFDALLARRRLDLLQYQAVQPAGQGSYFRRKAVSLANIPLAGPGRAPASARAVTARPMSDGQWVLPALQKDEFQCVVWHIDMSATASLERYASEGSTANPDLVSNQPDHPLIPFRNRLDQVIGQTKTNFRLSGPKGCDAKFLQDALYAAAFTLVREDNDSRRTVCNWLGKKKLKMADGCEFFPGNLSMKMVDLSRVTLETDTRVPGEVQLPIASCR